LIGSVSKINPLEKFTIDFNALPPASAKALQTAEQAIGKPLPDDYKSFLLEHNGGEGFIGEHYLILWKVEELSDFNDGYEVSKHAPGFIVFGSNGGGDGFAFDTRKSPYRVMQVPFVGMSADDGFRVAESFNELLTRMSGTTDRPSKLGRKSEPTLRGREIFEIQPVLLGGSPTDLENKTILTRDQHMEVVRYWNKVVSDLRKHQPR
jgi:cell wall assembly regulator SMI1